jgi:hypothetical protein
MYDVLFYYSRKQKNQAWIQMEIKTTMKAPRLPRKIRPQNVYQAPTETSRGCSDVTMSKKRQAFCSSQDGQAETRKTWKERTEKQPEKESYLNEDSLSAKV